jgi:hypothetical protein
MNKDHIFELVERCHEASRRRDAAVAAHAEAQETASRAYSLMSHAHDACRAAQDDLLDAIARGGDA